MSPTTAAGAVAASPLARIAGIRARFEPAPASTPTTTGSVGEFSSLLTSLLAATSTDGLGAGTAASLVTGAGGTASGQQVVDAATRYLGVPYRWGGTDPSTGLDCSGFVQQTFEDLGIATGSEGVLSMTMEQQRKRIYGINWKKGNFLR